MRSGEYRFPKVVEALWPNGIPQGDYGGLPDVFREIENLLDMVPMPDLIAPAPSIAPIYGAPTPPADVIDKLRPSLPPPVPPTKKGTRGNGAKKAAKPAPGPKPAEKVYDGPLLTVATLDRLARLGFLWRGVEHAIATLKDEQVGAELADFEACVGAPRDNALKALEMAGWEFRAPVDRQTKAIAFLEWCPK